MRTPWKEFFECVRRSCIRGIERPHSTKGTSDLNTACSVRVLFVFVIGLRTSCLSNVCLFNCLDFMLGDLRCTNSHQISSRPFFFGVPDITPPPERDQSLREIIGFIIFDLDRWPSSAGRASCAPLVRPEASTKSNLDLFLVRLVYWLLNV